MAADKTTNRREWNTRMDANVSDGSDRTSGHLTTAAFRKMAPSEPDLYSLNRKKNVKLRRSDIRSRPVFDAAPDGVVAFVLPP
jgi:hypothetical protein